MDVLILTNTCCRLKLHECAFSISPHPDLSFRRARDTASILSPFRSIPLRSPLQFFDSSKPSVIASLPSQSLLLRTELILAQNMLLWKAIIRRQRHNKYYADLRRIKLTRPRTRKVYTGCPSRSKRNLKTTLSSVLKPRPPFGSCFPPFAPDKLSLSSYVDTC